MFKIITKSIDWGSHSLVLETGKIARQAHGSVLVNYGGTSVLSTVVTKQSTDTVDFLPLTVQFVAKSYAIGKIPGGFLKREGKPSDRETLISRLIDRSIRPLFPEGFHNEISIVCNLLSYDGVTPPEVTALVGVASALTISGLPFNGPVAGVKVGYSTDQNQFILNPTCENMPHSSLDLFLSGNEQSILMVESEAHELSEQCMLDAMAFGHKNYQSIISLIKEFAAESDNKPIEFVPHDISNIKKQIEKSYKEKFTEVYKNQLKKERASKLELLRSKIISNFKALSNSNQDSESIDTEFSDDQQISYAIKSFERELVRNCILETKKRIDNREVDEIRKIEIEVDVIPKAHGSALFTRGDTQALVITALGTPQDEQIVDDFDGDRRESFLLHYNFPPYAVGEAAALRPPGRREIGHGKLAWRAIHPVLPDKSCCRYTVRVVSEITESDGSSSMATVCGASLALMDTGVKIKSAVAGIAMGLIKQENQFTILSDILGDEDHLGDMDFKVAGTKSGITALQMDMKICGINFDIIKKALDQAKAGRLQIIEKMDKVISTARDDVKSHAPKIESVIISKDKIRNVIGTGGKNIRHICEKTGTKIEVSQDGTVMIYAICSKSAEEAKTMIINSVTDPEIGQVFDGVIDEVDSRNKCAYATFLGSKRGCIHISEIKNEHIDSVDKVLSPGDNVKVYVKNVDRDMVQLSMRRIDQETGEYLEGELYSIHKKSFSSDDSDGSGDFKDSRYSNNKFDRTRRNNNRRPPSRHSSSSSSGNYNDFSRGSSGNSRHGNHNRNHNDIDSRKPRFF